MIVNAKDILTAEMMASFLASINANDDVTVKAGDFERVVKKDGIKAVWKSDELKAYYEEHQTEEFTITASNGNTMLLTHYDYIWWIENSRRINKLFKCLEDEAEQKAQQEYRVACGFKQPGKVFNIHVFAGIMKQCIDFLNEELKNRTLHNANNDTIVICMHYEKGAKNVWKTYDELKAEGTIV